MPAWVIAAQWAARSVLVVLMGLSVWSVAIMIDRKRYYDREQSDFDSETARKLIESQRVLSGAPSELASWLAGQSSLQAGALRAALEARSAESVELAVRSFLLQRKIEMEKGLTVLATLGSNAPFVGLFGTVLGIIHAFAALSSSQEGVSSVMTGISEALIATAVGLFVAIPAVVAYNYFSRRLRVQLSECESLKDFLVSRQLAQPKSESEKA